MIKAIKSQLKKFLYGGSQRTCTVCGSGSRAFLPSGFVSREDARCPFCNTVERHRLLMLFLKERTDLFDGSSKRFLHIAPERVLIDIFSRAVGSGYLTADLFDPNVMEKMDITDIQHPADTFDVIYCSHVLEHCLLYTSPSPRDRG